MCALPPKFFGEFLGGFIVYPIVLATLGGHLASQNFLKLFPKLAWNGLHRFELAAKLQRDEVTSDKQKAELASKEIMHGGEARSELEVNDFIVHSAKRTVA